MPPFRLLCFRRNFGPMSSVLRTCLVLFFFFLLLPAQAEEDLADRMDNALKLLRSAGQAEPRAVASMLNSAAEGYIIREDYDTALERITESLKICREHDFPNVSTSAFIVASRILNKVDDEMATQFLVRELNAPGTGTGYKRGVLKALDMHLAINGNQKLAIEGAHALLEIEKAESPKTDAHFWAMLKFGQHCYTGRLYDIALPTLIEARDLALEMKRPDLAAQAIQFMSYAFAADGKTDEARKLQEQELELRRAAGDEISLRFALQNLATTQIQAGKYKEATASLDEAESLSNDDFSKTYINGIRGGMLAKRAIETQDKDLLKQAVELARHAADKKVAVSQFPEGQKEVVAIMDYLTVAYFELMRGNLAEAEKVVDLVEAGVDGYEASQREAQKSAIFSADQVNLNVADQRAWIYDIRERVCIAKGEFEEALTATENGRGLAQAEVLKSKLGLPSADKVEKEVDIESIKNTAKQQNTTLVIYSLAHLISPDTRRYFGRNSPFQHPFTLHTYVVTPEGKVHFHKTALKGPLRHLIEMARTEITKGKKPEGGGSPSRLLSEVLLDPIRQHLPKEEGALVTIVPQQGLFLVPFSALPDEKGTYLIEQYTLGVSPSIDLLRLAAEQRKVVEEAGLKEFLLVGNPTMPGYQSRPDRDASALSPLPGAEKEVKFLGSILDTTPMIGDDATETAVASKMENARFLHFATHGLLESENVYSDAFLSSLAFAAGDGEDGFLTVKETARMKLRAELAVLSACDTGRGRLSGDGVIGLSRGFMTAGVPSVIVSLWPVSDAATAELMGHYYEALLKGEPKAAALRSATLATKKKYPDPSLWAPFVLYGLAE
ncbi:MAG: hypothetical protein CMO55_06845 [Verrucomicrobiales bacterium]|nr:hypothetical protein [Verrucomicrobiales bacterium]